MPFNQSGAGATANINTYNDVAGNQHTNDNSQTTTTKNVGNISAYILLVWWHWSGADVLLAVGGDGGNGGNGAIGGAGGPGGSVTVSL